MQIKTLIKSFHQEEVAATAVEYAVMLALIATVCIQVIALNGNEVLRWFQDIDQDMGNAINS